MNKKNNLVWIDLEMSGLDAAQDLILEIATLVTDNDLNIIAEGPSLVIHHHEDALAHMSGEVRAMHTKNGLLERVQESRISIAQAQQDTLDFIKQYCEKGQSPLCGNSVWVDRQFLQKYMPKITEYLHYRIIDVSTVKELVQRWYAPHIKREKKEAHRALDDIKESVAELGNYRELYFIKK